MKVLALDIGAGTKDILLYNEEKGNIENCIKMVLPSPSLIFAKKVKKATQLCKDIFIKGTIIGGGAFAHALKKHVEMGLKVFMTERSAYTIRNDLDEVSSLGIEIIHREDDLGKFDGEILAIEEVNIKKLQNFLAEFGESLSDTDVAAVAVQDHGVFPKGISNRRFRIQKMKRLLEDDPKLENLSFKEGEIPQFFLRMKSVAQALKEQLPKARILIMDTNPAAILGCLKDPIVEKANSVLAVNVGNCHTMAAIISNSKMIALMEHHTRQLTPEKIQQLLNDFADGKLSDEQVFQDGGHGSFYLANVPGSRKIEMVAATGPNRNILRKTSPRVHFAAPAGDVMMTGPIGLIEAAKRKFA
ncbi:MAG: DUF1786 domain-containing protein [Candidatus Bathyarchaeota archaeon]|nr:MAG: DUF1786 domain-containing protein [Candidatus Bathyarchaeota archaeon]